MYFSIHIHGHIHVQTPLHTYVPHLHFGHTKNTFTLRRLVFPRRTNLSAFCSYFILKDFDLFLLVLSTDTT